MNHGILGDAFQEQRNKIAAAIEKGDEQERGRLHGEVLSTLVGAGITKKVGNVVNLGEDLAKSARVIKEAEAASEAAKMAQKSAGANGELISRDGFNVGANKFDYFYGNVEVPALELKITDPKLYERLNHNYQRSKQLNSVFEADGFGNSVAGREKLLNLLENAIKGPEISRQVNDFGTTITRIVETSRVRYEVNFFYEGGNLNFVPKVSTVIPKVKK